MPTFPIFRCKSCDSAVQLESYYSPRNKFPGSAMKSHYSSELDTDDFGNYCKGQGRFYTLKKPDPFVLPFDGGHFNFSGAYQGLCCYCALGKGYSLDSFSEVGCYQCKKEYLFIKEFSKLKLLARGSEMSGTWESSKWAGLSDSLIELILRMLVGFKVKMIEK